jgi:integrase
MREIPICASLSKILHECHSKSDGIHVFCNESKQPYRNINTHFHRILERARITDFRFHDLRHTAASNLVMLGIDLVTIKEVLGHSNINMTLRYAHLSPVHKREAMETLGLKMDTFWTPNPNKEKFVIIENKQNILYNQAVS